MVDCFTFMSFSQVTVVYNYENFPPWYIIIIIIIIIIIAGIIQLH